MPFEKFCKHILKKLEGHLHILLHVKLTKIIHKIKAPLPLLV